MPTQILWPWQTEGVARVQDMLSRAALSICVTSPTGMGKGRQIEELAKYFLDRDGRVILFTNRKMLTRQTGDRFAAAGINFGYLSAEHGINTHANMIVASVQTVESRTRREKMELPRGDLLIVDEAHNRAFDKILKAYRDKFPGVSTVGYTASPIGLKGVYDHLVIAGTKEEGRKHGALVSASVYAPDEPDMRGVKMTAVGEYEHKGMVKRVMQCTVFADVLAAWEKHGGYARPTLLWAPGVPESRWFASQFNAKGVAAAHIDAETSEADRLRIAECSRNGTIKVVCSFGVLREGVDWPWISYGILVQVCGAFGTFTQTVGRILRAFPGKEDAILQDHSGTWWRHGSPNDDYPWSLDDTNKKIAKAKKVSVQNGDTKEPICCPNCSGIRLSGSKCPHCGYEHTMSIRMVRMESGELVRMKGAVVKRKQQKSREQASWSACLFQGASSGWTVYQAAVIYKARMSSELPLNVYPQPSSGHQTWTKLISDVYPNFTRQGRSLGTTLKRILNKERARQDATV